MSAAARSFSPRDLMRAAVVVIAVLLIVSWIRFGFAIFAEAQGRPAPAAIMLPVFFCAVAIGAALAALRGDGMPVALAGGLSLVPMGVLLLFFPGSPRVIGLLDLGLITLGVLLVRSERPAFEHPELDALAAEPRDAS